MTDVESRSGALYCQMCDDFIWDATMEELRMKKLGTGSFSSKACLSGAAIVLQQCFLASFLHLNH